MCEWLSHGEWCDVKLMCGGRAFNAHRIVLASVSAFLRRILLSCPADETPTFIVLPEFDLDAMSSVLYYIYNGEVVVQKEKLEMFLDIIIAMQIFIDSQYLQEKRDTVNDILPNVQLENNLVKKNIFKLGDHHSIEQRYIKLKKGENIPDVCLQSSHNSDINDNEVRCPNQSREHPSSFGNLKSLFPDRQRNFLLRDLCMETYPRNGNVNGLPAAVLAIPNECYRAPASVLLTNANAKHLGADDVLLNAYKKTDEHVSNTSFVCHHRKQRRTADHQDYGETSKSLYEAPYFNFIQTELKTNTRQFPMIDEVKSGSKNIDMYPNSKKLDPLYQLTLKEQALSAIYVPSLDLSKTPSMFGSRTPFHISYGKKKSTSHLLVNNTAVDSNGATKVAIFNQVLQNPWSPRTPINYKPFCRKKENRKEAVFPQAAVQKDNFDNYSNDSNNNLSQSLDEVTKPVVDDKVEEVMISVASNSRQDDFKCTSCNQVFTSSDSLSEHMRRHISNARYTCGECGKTFSQLRNFKYHMSIHKGTKEFAATCTVCGKYFNDRGYLSSHMKIHRNRKEYKCSQCPKSFNQRVAYNMHVRIHTGVKPHVCGECGKAFSRKMLLKQHQRTHSGERPYACPHCDKRFADRSNMTLHLRLHTGVKPFSCTLCPKSFTKKHHLKSHLNFHTGSKPYSCPRCKLAFTQSSNMRTHLKKCNAPEHNSEVDNTQQIP